jgi:hypothetical protein
MLFIAVSGMSGAHQCVQVLLQALHVLLAQACLRFGFPGHATEDTFVGKHHSERLVAAYAGDKNFITFRGDHNSVR